MELLLGCGASRDRKINIAGKQSWSQLRTLDINPDHKPDIIWDLRSKEAIPLGANHFDEIHAYEVLEHIGQQGDYETFFRQFSDYWRLLKPGGYFAATCPSWKSMWAWGDPSHSRLITSGTLVFLSQLEYTKQVGHSAMSDFRSIYKADFEIIHPVFENEEVLQFVLQAIKPARKREGG